MHFVQGDEFLPKKPVGELSGAQGPRQAANHSGP